MIVKGNKNKEVALILAEKLNCLLVEKINDKILEKSKDILNNNEIVIFLEDIDLPYKNFIFELSEENIPGKINIKNKSIEEIAEIILHR